MANNDADAAANGERYNGLAPAGDVESGPNVSVDGQAGDGHAHMRLTGGHALPDAQNGGRRSTTGASTAGGNTSAPVTSVVLGGSFIGAPSLPNDLVLEDPAGLASAQARAKAASAQAKRGPNGLGPSRTFKQAPKEEAHHETAAAVILSPKDTYDHIVATGVSKTKLTLAKQVTQGVLAGFYISFSFMLCMTVGGQISTIQHEHPGIYNFLLGSVGFPLGLTIIMVVGADLFTSSCMYMVTAWLEGRVATYWVIRSWVVSWFSNLAGCLIMAQLVVWAGLFAPPKSDFPIYLAHKKTGATFGATVVKGIICNWLVNLAVWMANSARDLTGKAVGVYLPVSAFVTLGTEHVIANQFELSLAKMLGSRISLHTMICSNWIPATIGNIIGGSFFVGALYAGVYGTLYERMWMRYTQLYVWVVPKRVRERVAAAQQAAYDRLFGWVDWDALTAPPADLLAPPPAPPPGGRPQRTSEAGGGVLGGRVSMERGLSAMLREETPRWVAAAFRNPPMTPFERKHTETRLGSDV